MIAEWFRPLDLSIPFSEFARLPRHPAYKYEYFGGRAVLTPRPRYRRATVDLTAFALANSTASDHGTADIRPLEAGDWQRLPDLLAASCQQVPPFATLSDELRLVHPWRFGQGLGRQLLASAAAVLGRLRYRELASTLLVGNEHSALWHWRNGFRLMPDAF